MNIMMYQRIYIYNTLKVASKTKSKSVGSLFNELVEKGGYRYKKLS